jgi:hypothetical protein
VHDAVIHRTEYPDMQAAKARFDDLLKSHGEAREDLQDLDEK